MASPPDAGRVSQRGLARALGIDVAHINRLVKKGVIAVGDDRLIDIEAARASIASSRSVAHGHMDEVNRRQRKRPEAAKPPTAAPDGAHAAPDAEQGGDPAYDPGEASAGVSNVRRQYDKARTIREGFSASLLRLEFQRKSGLLVERAIAERVLFECARRTRDAFLQFPSRAAPEIASAVGLADSEPLRQAIAEHVARLLEQMGSQPVDFDDPDR